MAIDKRWLKVVLSLLCSISRQAWRKRQELLLGEILSGSIFSATSTNYQLWLLIVNFDRFTVWPFLLPRRVRCQWHAGQSTCGIIYSRRYFAPNMSPFSLTKLFGGMLRVFIEICFFPFKCKHLLGGETILGKSIKEVLPKQAGHIFKKAFGLTRRRGLPQDVQCILPAGEQFYVASIRLFPYNSEVLGFITDYDLAGKPVIQVSSGHPSIEFLKRPSSI